MNKAEFDEALKQRFGFIAPQSRAAAVNRGPDFDNDITPQDVREALTDYLRANAGIKTRRIHPAADHALRERWGLSDLQSRAAMSGSDFGAAMESALTVLMTSRYEGFAADLPKFARELPASDYKPVGLATLDISEPPEIFDDLPLATLGAKVTQAATDGVLRQYAGKLSFSRAVMSTFGEQIAAGILGFASVFWSIEQRIVAAVLAAGTLGTAAGGLTVSGLGAGAYALRTGENQAGQPTGLPLHSIMVGAADEVTARILLSAVGWPAVGLIVNPYLPSVASGGSFYCFANPALVPGLVRLTLRGSPQPRVYSDTREVAVTRYALSHDVNYALAASSASAIIKVTPE